MADIGGHLDIADSPNRLYIESNIMYGKHFASMYEGSMIGSGAVTFAVMGYVIATAVPDKTVGTQVELNPKLLAFILGEKEKDVEAAIEKLCAPDPNSRTKDEDGKRLIRLGQFAYKVVNGEKYRAIRDEEARREADRERKRKERALKKGTPSPGEAGFVAAVNGGNEALADAIAAGEIK